MLGNILIGEDNLVSQQVMEALLETKCEKLTLVSGYAELIHELNKERYDLLLLDYHMDQDADFMVTQIRLGDSINKNIPVFILSAEPEIVVMEKMREIPFDGYVKKPIDFTQLEAALNHTLLIRSTSTNEAASSSDEIDLSNLEILMGNNPERVRQIVKIFNKEVNDFFVKMDQLLIKQDWDNLRALVHKARASYGYIGLTSLYTQLTQWESEIEAGRNQNNYYRFIETIKTETLVVLDKLEKLYPTRKS